MSLGALVDGRAGEAVPLSDRGFCYGDGVFETLRVRDGRPVWWQAHIDRLARGCAALGMDAPAPDLLRAEVATLCEGQADGVLRLVLTRGDGTRGYLPGQAGVRRVLSLHAAPPPRGTALSVGWAALRLSIQPRLAGIKHLNRLEQVLAARDCAEQRWDDALLCDAEGAATSAIAGNVFLVRAGRLETPLLDRCGVAGTCRAWVLAARPECRVARLSRDDVDQADELFLCNSVRGILPVARLGERELGTGPVTRALMRQLAREEPALAAEGE